MEKFLVEYKSAVEKKLAEYKCNTNTAIELKLGMYAFSKYCQEYEVEFCVRAVVMAFVWLILLFTAIYVQFSRLIEHIQIL